jgi:hypothetical protein
MVATSVEGRQVTQTKEFLDLARCIADQSADPNATYESFLLGLEMGMVCGPLQPGERQTTEIGSERVDRVRREDRIISDPRKPMIRKAPPVRFVSGADFPTEWTLDQ